jgi:DNA (cytosine-5)-methyltransferase 1
MRRWPTAVDLFCGCGAVSAALKSRRFRVVAAVDNDPIACTSYRKNHPTVALHAKDIRRVDPREIRRDLLSGRNLDLLVVCAPCQPFSSQNRKKGADARARLILSAVRFADILKPKVIFFENVPGLARGRFSAVLSELQKRLSKLDYVVGDPDEVDAADYAVPQRRRRCVLLARKRAAPPALPSALTPSGKRKTVRNAIRNLSKLAAGQKSRSPLDPLHFARQHHPIALKRLRAIPKNGGGRESLPKTLRLACHGDDDKSFSDVYGRMAWDDVAPTLTTGCTDITRGRFAHPTANRAITLREAARLQTFPDTFWFGGSAQQIATQIGNAVPVRLVEAFAPVLRAVVRP